MRHAIRYFVLAFALILLVGILPVAAQSDAAQAHKEAVRSAVAAFSASNPDALYNLFPEQYKMNQGGATLEAMSRADTVGYMSALLGAMPDLKITPTTLLAQGDEVAAELTFSGTFSQPFSFVMMGPDSVPPTNKPVTWTEMDFLHFNAAGLIDEQWSLSDPMVMFAQLGIAPAQDGAPAGTALEAPAGYQTLSADGLAATYTSGMETRNLDLFNQQAALGLGTFTQFYTDPYITWSSGKAFSVTASDAQQDGGFIDMVKQAMPDSTIKVDVQVAEGDWVAAVGPISGTFTQDVNFFGTSLTHTDQPINWLVGVVDRYDANGKIVEEWLEGDASPLLQGLGMMPAATPAS